MVAMSSNIFCILNMKNFTLKPSFCTIRTYLHDARHESSSDCALVTTNLPDAKIKFVSRCRPKNANGMEIEGNDGPAMALEVAGGDKGLICICGRENELDRDNDGPGRATLLFVVGRER